MSHSSIDPSSGLSQAAFLSQTLLFADLPAEHLSEIADLAIAEKYGKGEAIFQQGDPARGFFVIQSGRVKVFKVAMDGREQILHVFAPGDHFAEVPALDGDCFPAAAMAIEPTKILFFPRQAFLQLLEQQPTLTINLLRSFARHLRLFSQLVDNLALREVPARLATYLLDLSHRTGNPDTIELNLTKGQLAAQLGTIPETLSRSFAKLSRAGLIAIEGSQVQLLDRDRLKQLAAGE